MPDATSFRVVINYRRGDAAGHAGRLYDALSERFGEDNVFMDIDAIEPGTDFAEVIDAAVGSCDAFLAVVGAGWLNAQDSEGRRRLDASGDFVRMEIEAALAGDVRVIPVLVQGAEMPKSEDLPDSLARFARIQACELSDGRWQYDIGRLLMILENIARDKLGQPTVAVPPAEPARPRRTIPRWAWVAAGVAAVGVAALLFAVLQGGGSGGGGSGDTIGGGGAADKIAYSRQGSIFSVGSDPGETPTQLIGDGAYAPEWSPDGSRIAFSRRGDIWVADADRTGKQDRLTRTPASESSPAWSPDGTQLVFDSSDSQRPTEVWKMDADGGNARSLGPGGAPDWSSAGDEIAFQRGGNILVMNADGGGEHPVTDRLPGTAISAAWSPDGRTIAYVRIVRAGGRPAYYISTISPDGTGNTSHTRSVRIPRNYPEWSPDGERIAFTAPDGLWVVNRDGSGVRQLVAGAGISSPSWAAN